MRTGLLAETLAARGHGVVWWTSTFDHVRKSHRSSGDGVVQPAPGVEVRMIRGTGYRANVSLRRLLDHLVVGLRWRYLVRAEAEPAAIVCSMPTIELAAATASYATKRGVPFIIDVRDLWPDAISDALPPGLTKVGHWLLWPWRWMLGRALRAATVVTATSPAYLRWAVMRSGRPTATRDRVFPLGFESRSLEPHELSDQAALLRAKGLDESKVICWFVGTFGATYDLGTLIEAASLLSRRGVANVQVVLSGDGEASSSLRSLATRADNVVFTGWLDAAGLAYLSAVATIGLATYARGAPQSMPNKLFQYLNAAVPVVSSLGTETADLLATHQCGLTYEAGNAESLADCLSFLAGDLSVCREMGERGRQLYEERFESTRIYADMAELVEATVSSRA